MKFAYGLLGFAGCSGSALSQQQVYNLARDAGFDPSTAQSMVAIAMRESNLMPNCIATNVAGSSEASYGLWQINMSGSLKLPRLAMFGISDPAQLLDPSTNAHAAFVLSGGGSNLIPWHIDSDTAMINGKLVNLGYRTKYLANLASLPSTLESAYGPGDTSKGGGDGTGGGTPPPPPNSIVGVDPTTGEQVYIDASTGDILGPVGVSGAEGPSPASLLPIALGVGAAIAAWFLFRD